jgi:hypothetical protein
MARQTHEKTYTPRVAKKYVAKVRKSANRH